MLLQKEENQETKSTLSNNFLNYIDLHLAEPSIKDKLIEKIYQDDSFLKLLSNRIAGESGEELFHTLFKPLREENLLFNVEVINVLRDNNDGMTYTLDFQQKFKAQKQLKEFIVIFSSDNDIFNKIIYSKHCKVDSAIGVSKSEWHKISKTIMSMFLKGEKVKNGIKENINIARREIGKTELAKRTLIHNIQNSETIAFGFSLPVNQSEYDFDFCYQVRNSFSDPYYYWTAENPMYLNNIVINYERIKNRVGSISANCIMGNYIFEPIHDKRNGIFTVRANNLIWPGNGALIVWRNK